MPRNISAGVQALLDATSSSFCILVEIIRTDGAEFRYTSHDRPLTVDGETYIPNAGVSLSAFESMSAHGSVDNQNIQGLIDDDNVVEAELRAGLFRNALVTHSQASWEHPEEGKVILNRGYIGEVKSNDLVFTAEHRGLLTLFSQQIVEVYTPGCQAQRLGDARCKKDVTAFQHEETLVEVTDDHTLVFTKVATVTAGDYIHGFVIVETGANAGFEREIKNHTIDSGNNVITLQTPFPFDLEDSLAVTLEEGCDHLFQTCIDKFDNALNYQGFPHLPGNLKVMERGR